MTGNPAPVPPTDLMSSAATTVRRRPSVSAPAVVAAPSMHVICELARLANCGHCWARSEHPCAVGRDRTEGYHLARFVRAARRGLISAADFDAVLAVAGERMFDGAAIVFDDVPGDR